MGDKIKMDHLGGWPKLLDEEPTRPHADWFDRLGTDEADESDESDAPYDINHEYKIHRQNAANIYSIISVYVEFCERGLYPPRWAIEALAVRLKKHLDHPDSELLASQLGVTGKGSGATNPFADFTEGHERHRYLGEICMLLSGFDLSVVQATRIVIDDSRLEISEKTLVNDLYRKFGNPRPLMLKHRDYAPVNDPFMGIIENRREYVSKFEPHLRSLLKSKSPVKI